MALVQRARKLIQQFLHNLDEADWVSRHVADRGPDQPEPSKFYGADQSTSSLSLALRQMGLVRQSPEAVPLDYEM